MARSHFGFENHYIPAKHSSEVHTWSWLLYTGWIPHVHMLALITTQQLGMQVHKASLAGRKLFLEEFARPWVCCTAEPPARHVSATWGKNPLLMQCSCQIIAVWAYGKTCSQIQLSLKDSICPQYWLSFSADWGMLTQYFVPASIPAKWEGYLGAGSMEIENSLMKFSC